VTREIQRRETRRGWVNKIGSSPHPNIRHRQQRNSKIVSSYRRSGSLSGIAFLSTQSADGRSGDAPSRLVYPANVASTGIIRNSISDGIELELERGPIDQTLVLLVDVSDVLISNSRSGGSDRVPKYRDLKQRNRKKERLEEAEDDDRTNLSYVPGSSDNDIV
jgi:hypothetical protein